MRKNIPYGMVIMKERKRLRNKKDFSMNDYQERKKKIIKKIDL